MPLITGKFYDPAVAVALNTTATLALSAMDTTNLRLVFTVPSNGIVMVRIACLVHGATTFPAILLGVLEGTTIRGRMAPIGGLKSTALATAMVTQEAVFLVTDLTPGASLTWDAAYGVETLVAGTGIKYGGPNDTTANNAFGGIAYEIWTA